MPQTLRQMTGSEAQELNRTYLQRLMNAGVRTLNEQQKQVCNGLYFYGSMEYWQNKYNTMQLQQLKEFATEMILYDMEVLAECELVVDSWLAQGMPLNFELGGTDI